MSRDDKRKSTPEFSTVEQLTDRYQTSERRVRRWIKSGDLVAHRFGRTVRIHHKDRDTFDKTHRCPRPVLSAPVNSCHVMFCVLIKHR